MKILKFNIKFIFYLMFVIMYFSTALSKSLDKFEGGNYVSDYFLGILLLNDNKYDESYKFLKKLQGLEETHIDYSSKYLFSLVNSGKLKEAFYYAKKIEKRKLSNFETDLVIGTYYLKKNNYDLAKNYFIKLKNRKSRFVINNFLSDALLNWVSLNTINLDQAKRKINKIDSRFEKLKDIQNVFLHCFYDSIQTELYFENLAIKNQDTDFSRYNYFYASYLTNVGKIEKANEIVKSSLNLYPRNLLLNQLQINLKKQNYENDFNCKDLTHIIAEIFYIVANALSSQDIYKLSNFYLNLSKFLNNSFHSFDTLLAENFYKIDNFDDAKKIYNRIGKKGSAFAWYAAKQKTKILIYEKKNKEAIKLLRKSFDNLPEKNIYEKYDYALFLKNNDQFEEAIRYYTEIINVINKDHPLYPKVTDGRGVAYERKGDWEKAEKDLLASLESSPDQAYVINYLAYSWIEKGIKIEKSLKMLERANNLKSDDPFIIDSLGWALFKMKKYAASKNYLQSAVKLMPDDPVINDHYGDVLWKNGNKIQARYYWNYVLNLDETKDDLREQIENKLILGL